MTVIINSATIDTSSGKLTFEEDGHQIELRSGKIIVTDKFVSVDTYVFPKNTPIPVCYFAMLSISGFEFTYDVSTGSLENNDSGGTSELIKADYTDLLKSILSDSSITKTYSVSACQSNIGNGATESETECTYFKNNKGFDKSAYSASISAPSILCNNEAIPYTSDSGFEVTQNGNVLTISDFIVKKYVYASLMVTLS